jgi:hypothetical protein
MKEQQKKHIIEIMEADAKDWLYDTIPEQSEKKLEPMKIVQKKPVGWYCIGHAGFNNTTAIELDGEFYKCSVNRNGVWLSCYGMTESQAFDKMFDLIAEFNTSTYKNNKNAYK